ncbi:MAG: acetyl-CoA carboxylase biotin carboxyl carrier protein [Ignavibacteria bacterium]|jgi:acetyl-CoA carboxylase biotin carboxyl carrier protein|nr:acetyl-CoA carboxylase biotin carboxyl carrier protein [Ignavibacteria bacterium]
MDLKYLQKVIKMLDSSNLAELEIEEEGTKIRLSKPRQKVVAAALPTPAAETAQVSAPLAAIVQEKLSEPKTPEIPKENLYEVRSPMVGTFYRSPSPDSDAYTDTGKHVKAGDTICIIEAMKLMNEIESEVSGKVVKILVENATAVEYDQPLMLIEKD